MLNVPQVGGSSSTSLLAMIALLVVIGGPLLVLVALPQVRSKIGESLQGPKDYFYGPESSEEDDLAEDPAEGDSDTSTGPERRREIDDFDLNLFRKDEI